MRQIGASIVLLLSLVVTSIGCSGAARTAAVPAAPPAAPPSREDLAHAVTRGDLAAVRDLVARGADINAPNQQGQTLLDEVLTQSHMMSLAFRPDTLDPYAEILLDAGARATHVDLCRAIRGPGANRRLIEKLIRAGADVRRMDRDGVTPLYIAAMANDRRAAEVLLEHGADVQAARRIGFTPLHAAAEYDAPDAAEVLIAHGAKLDAREGSQGDTPLHIAAMVNAARAAAVLIAGGASVGDVNDLGQTPLDVANEYGKSKIAKMLRSTGIRAPNPADGAG